METNQELATAYVVAKKNHQLNSFYRNTITVNAKHLATCC